MTSTTPGPTAPLRPLGLGEVLDRAVSLSIRGFVPLALIYLVVAVPRAFIEYVTFKSYGAAFTTILKSIQDHTPTTQLADQMQAMQVSPFVSLAGLLVSIVLSPLTLSALAVACATLYFGNTITFVQAYRLAVERWLQIFLLFVIWIAVGGVIGIAVFIAFLILGIGFAALASLFKTVGVIFAAIAGLIALVALFGIALVYVFTLNLSLVICVVERCSFIDAFVSASRRVFRGIGVRRALLVALVYALISFGIGLAVAIGGGLLTFLAHQEALAAVYSSLLGIVVQIVTMAFTVIFYFDLRVRDDGLDIELDMNAAARGAAPL